MGKNIKNPAVDYLFDAILSLKDKDEGKEPVLTKFPCLTESASLLFGRSGKGRLEILTII